MKRLTITILLIMLFAVTACNKTTPTTAIPPAQTEPAIAPTITPTSVPMALLVNGEGITLEEYNAELARLVAAQTELNELTTPEEQKSAVLKDLEDQLLLAQAAVQNGFTVDDAALQARIDKLVGEIGGIEKLAEWQTTYGYTDATFRTSLRREILMIWQRDQIINSVPTTAEQIHARQILFQEEANANYVMQQLDSGVDFATLAYNYDPTLGGDLGWFPVDGLTQPNVAEAAFAIQPGEYTGIVQSEIGYHIVYVIERETDHELSVYMLRVRREQAIKDWLAASRSVSTIEELVP